MILKTGDLFRRFRVLGNAGQGGMGVVYRAHDQKLGRDVALKFVTQLGDYNPELHERLRREARSLAALSHPNIEIINAFNEVVIPLFLFRGGLIAKLFTKAFLRNPLSTKVSHRMHFPVAEALGPGTD